MTLVRSAILLTVAVGLANVLNAVLQFSLARIFEPDEYALLAALFAIVLVGAIPPLAFQATTAREVSARLARSDQEGAGRFLKGMATSVLRWSNAFTIAAILIVVPAAIFGADDPVAYGATVLTVGFALEIPVLWGGLQGTGQFSQLAGAHVLFAGSRLCAGLVIALAGGGVGAVMLGLAGATAVTILVSLLPLRDLLPAGPPLREGLATRLNASAAVGLTALWALAYGDLLVARLAFDGDEAGAYAAAAVASKVLLLVPIAATTVLFPRVAVLHDRRRERHHLLAGLGIVSAASALLTAFAWIFAGPLIDLLFGAEYGAAESWLGPLCLAMALYGLAIVYLYHFLALGRTRFALVLALLLAAQVVAYVLFHDSPGELIGVQIVFGAAAVVAAEAWYLLRIKTGAD
jgi:O-antigen/teichoic acid export membrane protein